MVISGDESMTITEAALESGLTDGGTFALDVDEKNALISFLGSFWESGDGLRKSMAAFALCVSRDGGFCLMLRRVISGCVPEEPAVFRLEDADDVGFFETPDCFISEFEVPACRAAVAVVNPMGPVTISQLHETAEWVRRPYLCTPPD